MLLTRVALAYLSASVTITACAGAPSEREADTPRAAAGAPANAAAHPLVNTSWRLTHLGADAALQQPEATLEFSEDGRVAGRGSCNRYSGPVEVEGSSIDFGVLAATRMACADEVMRQETRFFAVLNDADRWEVEGDTLLIHHPGAESLLRFARSAPGS